MINIEMMKPQKTTSIPSNDNNNLIYEKKYDGGSAWLLKKGDKVNIYHGNNHNPQNYKYPDLIEECKTNLKDGLYHAELCVFDNGYSKFDLFQKRQCENPFKIQTRAKTYPVMAMIHDICFTDGEDVREDTLIDRKNMLNLNVIEGKHVKIVPFYKEPDEILFNQQFLEGIVIKDIYSKYLSGKRQGYKFRFNEEQTVTAVSYEIHPLGVVLITDKGKRINLAGHRSGIARKKIDDNGKVKVEISYNKETDKGFRICSVKRVLV